MTSKKEKTVRASSNDDLTKIILETFPPFILAGLGMVFAGALLEHVQHWEVFVKCPELFILIPALLGLKGNLEMTLASRMSTLSNIGALDDPKSYKQIVISNLALDQLQAIVVGSLAALIAMAMAWLPDQGVDVSKSSLILVSSVTTAASTSLVLGSTMMLVIHFSRKYSINPDNVATPIAASLGDLVTLGILSTVATMILHQQSGVGGFPAKVLMPEILLMVFYLFIAPICFVLVLKTDVTKEVLISGWTPILVAMMISSGGGKILSSVIFKFPTIAAYQPVINGVAGNLVSVHASRISTSLHMFGDSSLTGKDNFTMMIMLLAMVVPGHFVFLHALSYFQDGGGSSVLASLQFLGLYFTAAIVQVGGLLAFAEHLIKWLWIRGTDPDSAAIPYLTSLGDFCGGILLSGAFYTNEYILSLN